MVTGGSLKTELARRRLGWRAWIAVLAIALVGATSAGAVWHEEHTAGDQDCVACRLRHQPAADLSGVLPIGPADAPAPLEPASQTGWIASGHSLLFPARAPPV